MWQIAGSPLAPQTSAEVAYTGGRDWDSDVQLRRAASDAFGFGSLSRDGASTARFAQILWGPAISQASTSLSSDAADNAEVLGALLRGAGLDDDLELAARRLRTVPPRFGTEPVRIEQIVINNRAHAILQAAEEVDGMGAMYRDVRVLGPLMSDPQQQALISKMQETLRTRLGSSGREMPSAAALGAAESIVARGVISYDKADLIERYADALRKVELQRRGIVEFDTRDFSIDSIGRDKLSPARWVAENETRYQRAFADATADGEKRFDSGSLRYPI